ncbi:MULTISPECIES: GGDEF domain-containing protein [unclassified Marinomonas]|uniref:GGDEF domain-containing protein n=1 Tax=unclassified Marinomonas TaxID=196814 RepID=UPI0007AFB17F|nr:MULTISPECIES: GGDEF domain-containing protein [unclassified Marinomonas]
MKFESLPKHFFHSLKFKMLVGFVLMFACIGMMNWISMDRLQTFENTIVHNTQEQLPIMEAASIIQIQVASLSGLMTQMAESDSQAELRIVSAEINHLLKGLAQQLERLSDSKSTEHLLAILMKLTKSLETTSHIQNQHIIKSQQVAKNIKFILSNSLDSMEYGSLLHRQIWIPISKEISLLSSSTKLFEISAAEKKIKRIIAKHKASKHLLEADDQALLQQIMGDVGLFYQLKVREEKRKELSSITTQNQILLDGMTEDSLRLFDQKSQEVQTKASELISTIEQTRFNYFVIIVFGLILFVLSLLYLKEILFSRLIMLSNLIRSGNLNKYDLQNFDLKNEIGDIAFQLSNYLTTIDSQRNQLKQASEQLANVIKFSKLRIAIVQDEQIVYHNQSFPRLFDRTEMRNVGELPAEISKAITRNGLIRHTSSIILKSFYSESWQRWFDVSSVTILWEGKESSLISLVDVTDRENAAKEFKETISLVEKESQKDALTGLYNRKIYASTLDLLEQQSADESFAMLVCDIDNFKAYNDSYGHQSGDDALRAVAQTIASFCQHKDVALRYGGEEFLLVLFDRSPEGASDIAQRIINQVHDLNIIHKTSEFQRVTVSIGVAIKDEPTVTHPRACFELADQRLYIAKRSGRNQLIDQSTSLELEG